MYIAGYQVLLAHAWTDKLSVFGFAIHGCIDGYVIMMALDSFLLNNCTISHAASLEKYYG